MTTPDRRQRLQGLKDTFACQAARRFALIALLDDEARDSRGLSAAMAPVAARPFKVEIASNQAVWPSNSPVLGIFFACCGVIFAVS